MNILIAEPKDFHRESLSLLRGMGEVHLGPFSRQELLKAVKEVHVLILRLGHLIDREILDTAKNLKYILTPTTGLDHIETREAEEKGVKIISLRNETEFLSGIPSTAEHTWALMMSLLRKIPAAHQHVLQGNWDREGFKAHNLCHYRLGILGYGRVGKQIAAYAEVFKMPYIFYDTDSRLYEHPNAVGDLRQFMEQTDILSIHIPLNEENRKFLNSSNLKYLKKGAYIINTSRGEILDEKHLAYMLEHDLLGGLATDVLDSERDTSSRMNNQLLLAAEHRDNVIITPHIAGATYESMWRTEEFVIRKWLDVLEK